MLTVLSPGVLVPFFQLFQLVFDAFHNKKGVQSHCTQRTGAFRHLSQGAFFRCSQVPGFPALLTSLPAPGLSVLLCSRCL